MPDSVIQAKAPLLLSDAECAALCGIGRRTWNTYRTAGKVPPSIRMGGLTRWRRSDIELWVELGCPSTEKFLELQGAA